MKSELIRLAKWGVVAGCCALLTSACGRGAAPTAPTAAALSATNASAGSGIDGPLLALKQAVANCGAQGSVHDVLQAIYGGPGLHSPAIQILGDTGSVLTFRLGTTVFAITYSDSNGDGHLSCGDTVISATP